MTEEKERLLVVFVYNTRVFKHETIERFVTYYPAVKKELSRDLGDIPQDMLKRIMDGLPPKASFYQDIEIDKHGLIYVFLPNPTGDSLQAIDIFSPEGKYLYSSQLRVEEGLSIQVVYLWDDLLVIAAEDEEGTIKVIKYSVDLPVL